MTDRWKNIVTLQEDIKTCICTSTVLEDRQIDKEVEKAEASLEDYAGKHSTFKKEYAEIKDRVNGYIDKMKRSSNRAANINSPANSNPPANNLSKVPIFKPQPELKPILPVKDCQLLEFTTWGKNFISYIKSSSGTWN